MSQATADVLDGGATLLVPVDNPPQGCTVY